MLAFILIVLVICIALYGMSAFHTGGYYTGGAMEVEARWLDIDIPEMREKIEDYGGKLVHDEKQYRRYVFGIGGDLEKVDVEGPKNSKMNIGEHTIGTKNKESDCKKFIEALSSEMKGYARTREEYRGSRIVVTMTCKLYPPGKHADEYEVETTNTLKECQAFLLAIGLDPKAYHETRRIKYSVKPCNEVTIDTIPGLPPYVEIDCNSEKAMFKVAHALGLKKGDEYYGPYGKTFEQLYGLDQKWIDDDLDRLDFKTFEERLKDHIIENKELFQKVVDKYLESE
jgi:adenylate cyclase class 2